MLKLEGAEEFIGVNREQMLNDRAAIMQIMVIVIGA